MSFRPRSRFSRDSPRSPSEPNVAAATPSKIPQSGDAPNNHMPTVPATTAATTDPANPSQDFFGEIFGAES